MKKKIMISVLSLLAVACILPVGTVSASAATLNTPATTQTVDGVTYKKYSYSDGSGKQVLFYGEYNATAENSKYEYVIHNVRNDSGSVVLTNVQGIAADYTAKTGRKVVMATNGDYFSGVNNVESLVMEGIVYTIGSFTYKHCLGFDNEGNTAIGRMTETENFVEVTTKTGVYYYEIDKINQVPDDGELAVYSTATNVALEGCCKYKVMTDSTNVLQFAPTEGTFTRMTTGTVVDDKSLTLNSGEFAIVVKGENELSQFLYDNVKYGYSCRLVKKPAGAYEGMDYVIGGYDILVNDGVANTNCHTDNSGNANAPRTFIGVKEDGTMFLGVLDGRQSGYSIGCTVNKEAQLALELGAKYALELDGGGSSTFLFDFNDGNGLTLLNKPSDGAMRKVTNAVLLVEKPVEETPDDGSSDSVPDVSVPDESESDANVSVDDGSSKDTSGSETASGCFSSASIAGVAILPAAFVLCLKKKRK